MRLRSSKGSVTLDTHQPIGAGGEAAVYAVRGDSRSVAKIYRRHVAQRGKKLRAMLTQPPADPGLAQGLISIAWPQDILLDASGAVAGYLMPAVRGHFQFSEVYHPHARRQSLPAGFGFRYLLRTAHNLCAAVAAVHYEGHVIGDLNDSNILVGSNAWITLIDTDSFQVGNYRCLVGRPEYTAPELHGQDFETLTRKSEQDLFALAILVYQLLMAGRHPFAGIGGPGELDKRIKAGLCPHAQGGPRQPVGAPKLDWLPLSLQRLIMAAFVEGHAVPSRRPSARLWAEKLMEAEKALIPCSKDLAHPHFNHHPGCPACQRKSAPKQPLHKTSSLNSGANRTQQPLPPPGKNKTGVIHNNYLLAAIVVAVFIVSYYWKPGGSVMSLPAVTFAAQQQTVSTEILIPSVDEFDRAAGVPASLQRTASEIYQEAFGIQPRQPAVNAPSANSQPLARPGQAADATEGAGTQESASEIYTRIMGR